MMKAINKKLNSFNLYLFCVYLTKAKNTTHGRLLWVCVCPQSISLLCGYAMTEVICRESLHFSGYWLAYWYTQHSVCFCSEAGMRAGACLRGRDYLSPKARKSRFKNRTEWDKTGQDRGVKQVCTNRTKPDWGGQTAIFDWLKDRSIAVFIVVKILSLRWKEFVKTVWNDRWDKNKLIAVFI